MIKLLAVAVAATSALSGCKSGSTADDTYEQAFDAYLEEIAAAKPCK